MKNLLSMNRDEMNRLAAGLDRAANYSDDAASSIATSLGGLANCSLFSGAINSLSSNISKVSQMNRNVKSKIINQSEATFAIENNFAKKLDEIEVPRDFIKNSPVKYNNIVPPTAKFLLALKHTLPLIFKKSLL